MTTIQLSPVLVIALAVLGVMAFAFAAGYVAGYARRSLMSWRRRRESDRDRPHRRDGAQRRSY